MVHLLTRPPGIPRSQGIAKTRFSGAHRQNHNTKVDHHLSHAHTDERVRDSQEGAFFSYLSRERQHRPDVLHLRPPTQRCRRAPRPPRASQVHRHHTQALLTGQQRRATQQHLLRAAHHRPGVNVHHNWGLSVALAILLAPRRPREELAAAVISLFTASVDPHPTCATSILHQNLSLEFSLPN